MKNSLNVAFSSDTNLQRDVTEVRQKILESLFKTGGGHYGGSLSVVDILFILYVKIMDFNPSDPTHFKRDRLILSKGHAAIALYSVFAHFNLIKESSLINYGKLNAGLEGHPDMTQTAGVDFSTGSLGQGLSVGIGMALGLKEEGKHVWVILGDGECQEGQIWEAAMFASRYKIDNIHVVIDANGAQEFGFKYNPTLSQEPITNMAEKWESFGWCVQTIDGHNHLSLERAFLDSCKIKGAPSVIIAKTRKGAGVPMFEKDPEHYHCIALTEEEHHQALKELTCNSN